MREGRFPRRAAIFALLLLVLVMVLAYAWIDGGAEQVHEIAEPIQPEPPQ